MNTTMEVRSRIEVQVEVGKNTLRTLFDLAVAGYNTELRFKSARRFRGESDNEFALRKLGERQVIDTVRPLVKLDHMNPPVEIEA